MRRETRNDAVAHIPDAQDRATAVTACSSIGSIMSCPGACSHRKRRSPMTGLWRISLKSGARSYARDELSYNRFSRDYTVLTLGRSV